MNIKKIKKEYSILGTNMAEEVTLEFRLKKKKKNETRNYLSEEINHNDLISEKYKKICKYLNFVEHLLILISTVIGYSRNKSLSNYCRNEK